MDIKVPVSDKKEFVRKFLKQYQMKRRECVWILYYLLSHDDLLNKVHFVEGGHYCPRAMVMSVTECNGVPFRFYKGNVMTADAEKSFHDLRLHPNEDMFIQLNFPQHDKAMLPFYLAVLEENPYIPKPLTPINKQDSDVANSIIAKMIDESSIKRLQESIDYALDMGDKELFMKLTNEMRG